MSMARTVRTYTIRRPSLSKIAKRVHVSPSHVSKVLKGRPCRLRLFKDIADTMGLTMDELYKQVNQ